MMNKGSFKGKVYYTKVHFKIIELYSTVMDIPGIKTPALKNDYDM